MNTPAKDSSWVAYKQLQERNALRLEEAKKKLGEKWLLHPTKQISRKPNLF